MIQKTNVWKTAAGLLLTISMMISSVPVTAAVAEPAVQVESTQASDYGAPAYGTKAANLHRIASQEQVQTVSKALQPVADVVGVMTKSHNVSVINYSDVDELGLIRRSDASGVVLVMDGSRIYIATAAHCLKQNHTEVILPDGTKCSAAVLYRSTETDTGFLTVEYSQLPEEVLVGITPAAGATRRAWNENRRRTCCRELSGQPKFCQLYRRSGSNVRRLSEQSWSECAAVLFGNELRFKRRRGLYAEWDLGWKYFRR